MVLILNSCKKGKWKRKQRLMLRCLMHAFKRMPQPVDNLNLSDSSTQSPAIKLILLLFRPQPNVVVAVAAEEKQVGKTNVAADE